MGDERVVGRGVACDGGELEESYGGPLVGKPVAEQFPGQFGQSQPLAVVQEIL